MADYLNVMEKYHHDDSIKREYYLEHQSFNNACENNDEIRIEVRNKEKFTVPGESYLQIEGYLDKPAGALGEVMFTQNGFMHLFDEIRYEVNGKEIDKVKNVGVVTTIKGLCSFTPNDITRLHPGGWKHINDSNTSRDLMDNTEFVAQYPLSACMGFFERFRRVLINCTQTLVLIRSSRDVGAIELIQPVDDTEKKEVLAAANIVLLRQTSVKITKIKWIVKYFEPNVKTELGLMRILDGKRWLPLEYQHWDIAVYPMVPQTTHHTWAVRTFSNVEKPRYLLIALGRDHSILTKSDFQHGTLRNVKAYLNSDEYPYENYNADFDAGKYTSMYNAYARFQSIYYGRTNPQPLLDRVHYKELGPIVVIDCSKQNDTVKTSTVDLRLDFECANSFPQNISLYCVIIHDCQMEYNAFSGEVRKL